MVERSVLWTSTAQDDLDAIVDYIAADSIDNALSVLSRLQGPAETLTSTADRVRLVPELRMMGVHQYREIIERPWRILYRIERERVVVLAVLDGRRDLGALLLERLVRG